MQVLQQRRKIDALGAQAIFVVHDRPQLVRRMLLQGLDVPYPIVVDQRRVAYKAWGLTRASRRRVWFDPSVWLSYARLLAGGERIRGLGEDTLQLGGDFVVGRDGSLVYSRPQRRDDRPPVQELLGALQDAAARSFR